jgi:hypothetical protein
MHYAYVKSSTTMVRLVFVRKFSQPEKPQFLYRPKIHFRSFFLQHRQSNFLSVLCIEEQQNLIIQIELFSTTIS